MPADCFSEFYLDFSRSSVLTVVTLFESRIGYEGLAICFYVAVFITDIFATMIYLDGRL